MPRVKGYTPGAPDPRRLPVSRVATTGTSMPEGVPIVARPGGGLRILHSFACLLVETGPVRPPSDRRGTRRRRTARDRARRSCSRGRPSLRAAACHLKARITCGFCLRQGASRALDERQRTPRPPAPRHRPVRQPRLGASSTRGAANSSRPAHGPTIATRSLPRPRPSGCSACPARSRFSRAPRRCAGRRRPRVRRRHRARCRSAPPPPDTGKPRIACNAPLPRSNRARAPPRVAHLLEIAQITACGKALVAGAAQQREHEFAWSRCASKTSRSRASTARDSGLRFVRAIDRHPQERPLDRREHLVAHFITSPGFLARRSYSSRAPQPTVGSRSARNSALV